ncbi:MAG TPA: ISL3 family transposase [Candidatus Saccharimonadales bacterium]|nr:ISL3 family transposase [Candidatus Saccharimonadales bacterium]
MEESVNEHYRQLLRLPKPWKVTAVEKDLEREKVTVCVRWPEQATVACPQCGKKCGIYDRMAERAWRHLSVMQYTLEVKCAVPRCDCPEHGVKTIAVPWAEPGSRFTVHFEAYAVAVIEACRSLTQAADLLRLHWDSVQRIIERAVERGLARRTTEGIRRVGLDEKSFRRGQRYISLMTDLNKQRVLEVVPGRDTKQAVALWKTLPDEQRKTVEAAAMDMGANFVAATRIAAPQAAIVHDRFHVAKHLNKAVDQTRRQEAAKLAEKGDETLKKTRYLWLHGTVPEKHQATFADLLEMNLKTSRAWLYKEQMVEFWGQSDAAAGERFFSQWYRTVMRSRLPKVKAVANTLKSRLVNLLTYFQHRITNTITEGFNSKTQAIKADARGFRRFENYRARILFFCGKLDLMPTLPCSEATHTIP